MGIYLSDELDTLTAQPIINRLMKTIDDISHNIYTNYIQDYTIDNVSETEFSLDYIPLRQTLFFIINGVAYENNAENTFYEYDETTNKIRWIFDHIPMEVGFRVDIVYSFDIDANNTTFTDVINSINNS